jgi:sugar (pentulose or hexulose) kinase
VFGENCVYSSSYYYDVNKLDYYEPMLDYLNISRDRLPEIVYTGTNMGNITKEAADETGLSTNTKFIAGTMGQVAGAIGAGNIREGIATETTDTAFAMITTINNTVIDRESRFPCQPHVIKGKLCLMSYSMTGGMVLKWFKDNFFDLESDLKFDDNKAYNMLTSEAASIPPGSEGLIMLPHLKGAFFPENNLKTKGVFFGIGINHKRGHFVRAIMESIAFMLKRDLWNQIKADITGLELIVPANTETALLGAAIIAGVGIGVYKDFLSATDMVVKIRKKYIPDIKNRIIYDMAYKKYIKLYNNVKYIF